MHTFLEHTSLVQVGGRLSKVINLIWLRWKLFNLRGKCQTSVALVLIHTLFSEKGSKKRSAGWGAAGRRLEELNEAKGVWRSTLAKLKSKHF